MSDNTLELDFGKIHERLPGTAWSSAKQLGDDSFVFDTPSRRIIISIDLKSDPGIPWIHASMSYYNENFYPTYRDLKMLHAAVFGGGHAYQCFVPTGEHINIRDNVLHLWGRMDGARVLPNFGRAGTI